MSQPLAGLRILVPPSRLDRNPLIVMLERNGAEVVVFPALETCPVDTSAIAGAASRADVYDWILFGGAASVDHFCEQLEAHGRALEDLDARFVTIGAGALGALRKRGRKVDHRPRIHTAEGVAEGMLPVNGKRVLLLRGAPTREQLPALLTEHGARVDSLIGHSVQVVADADAVAEAFRRRIDLMALANPATARLFLDAMQATAQPLERCLGGVTVAAIGPGTAEAMEALGLPADFVAGGRLKLLVAALLELCGRA